ncbi:MAG: DUF2391 family protein [Theionarchaea archaeon]|nr:DUF2391 family protein [Theionarchaea archaeon]
MEKSPQEKVSEHGKNTNQHIKRFQTMRSRIRTEPEIFGFDDMAQQIIGASLLSSPFCATEEIWRLADTLTTARMVVIVILSILLGAVMIYFTDYQKVADSKRFGSYIPVRIISLVCVSYCMVTVILFVLGVFDYGLTLGFEPIWRVKCVVLVGFFAILGGAVVDVIR